jgi:hypothetical protein
MRAKKTSWDKTAIFLSIWRQKKNNQRTKLSIYILDTIESESTTRSKNRINVYKVLPHFGPIVSENFPHLDQSNQYQEIF